MDILVVGGGGREHALVWALKRSPSVDRLYCTPGNAGIARDAECLDIRPGDLQGLAMAADDRAVDLVVVGPEAPLTSGLADLLDSMSIPCFGPGKAAAIIEGSKAFAKSFMQRHDIPTAGFEVFSEPGAAIEFTKAPPWGFPVVVKADGLAAGKGVLICEDAAAARAAIEETMIGQAFGAAGSTIVIEQFLRGDEVTIMALSDGERAIPLLPSQDHKQAYDGDRGPNTGGMGAFAPAFDVADHALIERITEDVLQRTIDGMAREDRRFSGVLYAGLMLTDDGPMVLEFNCRFGDPEAQVIIPLIDGDFAELLAGLAEGSAPESVSWTDRHSACVILAADGYPGKYRHGDAISGLDAAAKLDDVMIFHSGTAAESDGFVTSGGRVLGVTALGDSRDEALARAYSAADMIKFQGKHFRTDIGHRGDSR